MDKTTALARIATEPFADRRDSPLWLQIYDRLARAIEAGVLSEGERLPGEEELAQLFGVTRITLRRALDRHQREGRLQARKGVGVFVRAINVRYVVHPHSAHNDPTGADRMEHRTIALHRRPASAFACETFGITSGDETVELTQLLVTGQAPVYLTVKEFPLAIFPDFEAAYTETGGILGAYAAHGVDSYIRSETRLTGDFANPDEAELLRLSPGAPVLRARSWNRDPQGRAIEVSRGCWPMFGVELVFGAEDA